MADSQEVHRSRADDLRPRTRKILIGAAGLCLVAATVLAFTGQDCSTTTVRRAQPAASPAPAAATPAASPAPAAATPAATPPAPTPAPTATPTPAPPIESITKQCKARSLLGAPLGLTLLALLFVSPWIRSITIGNFGVDTAGAAPDADPRGVTSALAPSRPATPATTASAPDGPVPSPSIADSRARVATVFVEGADLPAPWDKATLLFARPTIGGPFLVLHRAPRGRAPLSQERQDELLKQATEVINEAVRDPGEVSAGQNPGNTTILACAGVNGAGRPVAAMAAVLPSAPADAATTEAAEGLRDLSDSWARVIIDVFGYDDDN